VRVLAVCGSLQAKSANLDLLRQAIASAPEGMEVVLFDRLGALPLFNPDIEAAGSVPEAVEAWRRALSESDAVLIASPEYGHSLPGAVKNAVDWVIGSGELHQKTVAITCAVPASERGKLGLAALRQTLLAVNATVLGGEPIVKGPGAPAAVRALLCAIQDAPR
jgi:chromate reductase, NAD(P)H dehydrogenase (quinone)